MLLCAIHVQLEHFPLLGHLNVPLASLDPSMLSYMAKVAHYAHQGCMLLILELPLARHVLREQSPQLMVNTSAKSAPMVNTQVIIKLVMRVYQVLMVLDPFAILAPVVLIVISLE